MPGTSHCGSSPGRTSSATRIPASTGSSPRDRTVRPSNSKPSTGEPSGASALETSIPPGVANVPGLTRLARKQIEDVLLADDADRRNLADVAEKRAGALEPRPRERE